MRIAVACVALALLPGCIAKTAVDIVTLPVKAVGAGVDAVTTSEAEADRKRGREMRKQDERERKQQERDREQRGESAY